MRQKLAQLGQRRHGDARRALRGTSGQMRRDGPAPQKQVYLQDMLSQLGVRV